MEICPTRVPWPQAAWKEAVWWLQACNGIAKAPVASYVRTLQCGSCPLLAQDPLHSDSTDA